MGYAINKIISKSLTKTIGYYTKHGLHINLHKFGKFFLIEIVYINALWKFPNLCYLMRAIDFCALEIRLNLYRLSSWNWFNFIQKLLFIEFNVVWIYTMSFLPSRWYSCKKEHITIKYWSIICRHFSSMQLSHGSSQSKALKYKRMI